MTGRPANRARDGAERLARAEAAVARLAADYPALALKDVENGRAALDHARRKPEERHDHLRRLYSVAHDIKGQGGSFGYPLVTRIGHSLCHIIASTPDAAEADLQIMQAHLDALTLILERRIKGDGSKAGDRLVERLEALAGRIKS